MGDWNTAEPDGPKLIHRKKRVQTPLTETPQQSLWASCPSCQQIIFKKELLTHLNVCPHCSYHMPLGAQLRLNALFDKVYGSIGEERQSQDLIGFVDQISYSQRLKNAQKKTGLSEALLVQYGLINNQRVVIAAFDFDFIGGSMGKVVGERFVQAVHFAIKQRYPLVCIATSGGARMQESLYALMQMRQTAAALAKLSQHGSPYIVILASPCMGGVSASLAMLGDIIIAEPRATIGFTGRRVIEQTMKQRLPDDFQQSEFLLAHGAIDMIVDRRDLKEVLLRLLRRLSKGASI